MAWYIIWRNMQEDDNRLPDPPVWVQVLFILLLVGLTIYIVIGGIR